MQAGVYWELSRRQAAERILDSERIHRILNGLACERASGAVLDERAPVGSITPIWQKEGSDTVRWIYQGASWTGPRRMEINSPLSLYRFELEPLGFAEGTLVTSLPRFVDRIRSRSEPRVTAPPGVTLRYQRSDGANEQRPIQDISHRGVRFLMRARDWLTPGKPVYVVVDWGNRSASRARLVVRHVSDAERGRGALAGASLEFDSFEDFVHYRSKVDALMDETQTTSGRTQDLFDLYEKSGYLELSGRRPSEFFTLMREFHNARRKLAAAPRLGTQVVWPSHRGIEATSAVIALHRRAAFLYHVAKRRGSSAPRATGRVILHAMYQRSLSWIRANNDIQWLVVWVQDASTFPKRLHLDFVSRYAASSEASLVSFRALEFGTSESHSGPSLGEYSCRRADAGDIGAIAAAARAVFPDSFLAAHALFGSEPVDFGLWRSAGLRRGRELVVVKRGGRQLAAAVIEHGENGVHLYNLFDVVWFIPLAREADAALAPLLQHAKAIYRELGKHTFYLAHDPIAPPTSWPEGARDRALIHCTVMSRALLPEFAEHAWELTIGTTGKHRVDATHIGSPANAIS